MKIEGKGTLKFIIDDDDGVMNIITVPNSVYIPDLPMVLVSPQHWSQQMPDGTESISSGNYTILSLRGHREMIPYSIQSNTPIFRSIPGALRYQYFAALIYHDSFFSEEILCYKHIVTYDKASSLGRVPEGDTGNHDGYNSEKELPMSDQ